MHHSSRRVFNSRQAVRTQPQNKPGPSPRSHRVNAKLTEDQVREALDLRNRRGWSPQRIATKLKISRAAAEGVISGGCGARTLGQ